MKSREEIEQLAFKNYGDTLLKGSFIHGYTQCQEDMADKKYTEEDIREAIDMARMLSHVACLEEGEHRIKYSNTEDEVINSLNKQD